MAVIDHTGGIRSFTRGFETHKAKARRKAREEQRRNLQLLRRVEGELARTPPTLPPLSGQEANDQLRRRMMAHTSDEVETMLREEESAGRITPEQAESGVRNVREHRVERRRSGAKSAVGGFLRGLDWYDRHIVAPTVAGVTQIQTARSLGDPLSSGQLPGGSKPGGAKTLEHPPVNVFKATYDDEEAQKAQDILGELDPVSRIAVTAAYDPTNVLPIVGFGPDVKSLVETARMGGPRGLEALRTLATDVRYRDDIVRVVKEFNANEAGKVRFGKPKPGEQIVMYHGTGPEGIKGSFKEAGLTDNRSIAAGFARARTNPGEKGKLYRIVVNADDIEKAGDQWYFRPKQGKTFTATPENLEYDELTRILGEGLDEAPPPKKPGRGKKTAQQPEPPAEEPFEPAGLLPQTRAVTPRDPTELLPLSEETGFVAPGLDILGREQTAAGLARGPMREAGERVPLLEERTFTSRAKEYLAATQQQTAEGLARREDELRRSLLYSRSAAPEEVEALRANLIQTLKERNALREEMGTAIEAMQPPPERVTGFSHQRVTPVVDSLDNIAETAFGRSGWQRKVGETLSHGPTGFMFRAIDPSRIHQASPIGRPYVAFERLSEIMEANTELGMRALRGYNDGSFPFKVTREGIEETTGKHLPDLIENWDTFKGRFGPVEDGFVNLYNRFRLDLLEDSRKLGVYIPNQWQDVMHVFRQVRGKHGIEFQRALQAGARGQKPGSFKHRLYEIMEEGRSAGIDYNADFMQVVEAGALALRRHAAETAFVKSVKGRGQLISRWVPSALKATRAEAGQRLIWAKRVQHYIHESTRGRPPRPVLRSTMGQDPPDDLIALVDAVAGINKTMDGTARQEAVRPFRNQIDELTKSFRDTHKVANKKVQQAVEQVNRHAVSGGPFGMEGVAEVGLAPASKFPNFQGRLFLKDDLDYLEKVWAKNSNPFLSGAAATSDVFRMGATAVDPGFWFVQGLGAIGLDTGRLLTGKAPTNIWGKSAWRSVRNAVTNGKSAHRYFARELELHPEELGEFTRYYRSLTSHASHSDEFIGAVQRGGILEKVEGAIPGLKQASILSRAGNAFAFYMDSFAWEAWKALKPLAKDESQLEELGAMLRSIVGKSSSRGLGISQTQRLAERAFVAWAPAYTRGSFALMVKAATDPTSFGGRQALKSMAGLAAASTLMGAGVIATKQLAENGGNPNKMDWEDLGSDLASFWDVTHPSKFFTIRIGENNFGIGGAMRSNTAMISRLSRAAVEDPASFSPYDPDSRLLVNFDNPLLRAIRAKTSPLTGEAFNILSGEDYLGFQLDDPAQYLKLTEDATPFALQAYLQAEGGIQGKVGAGAAEFFGFRSYPVRHVDLYHEAAEKESGQSWENLEASGELSLMRDDADAFPETAAAWEDYQEELRRKGSTGQAARDVEDEYKGKRDEELSELATGIQWNRPGGGQFYKDQRPLVMASARQSREIALSALGDNIDDFPESENKDAILRSKYYELDVSDFLGPDNKPNWEAFYSAKEQILTQMSPLAQEAVEKKKLDYDDPKIVQTEKRRLQATDDLQRFFDFPKYNGLTVAESEQVDELLELGSQVKDILALSGKSIDRNDVMKYILTAGVVDQKIAATAFVATKTNLAPMVKSRAADEWVLSHPDLAVFFPFVWDSLGEEDQLEWQRLYSLRK